MALAAGVKVAAAVAAAAALASVAAAAAPVPRLPAPSFTEPGQPTAFAVSGSRVAVASGCTVLVANLARGTKPVRVRSIGGDCGSDPGDSWVLDLHLGRATVMGTTISSPSPHGDGFTLVTGPLLGPLHEVGGWDWRDDDVPHAGGCDWSIAAGGGAVAFTPVPNRYGVDLGFDDEPVCLAGPTATIRLQGAARTQLRLPGSWKILATDGKRLALARLDAEGLPTGELQLVDVNGAPLPAPQIAAADVSAATGGWLTPQGLVLDTRRRLVGPGWAIEKKGAYMPATVAEGRVFYLRRKTIRVRRVRGGPDRALMLVPSSANTYLGAGSFGLAVGLGLSKTSVYRVPWRTIDRTLPAR